MRPDHTGSPEPHWIPLLPTCGAKLTGREGTADVWARAISGRKRRRMKRKRKEKWDEAQKAPPD